MIEALFDDPTVADVDPTVVPADELGVRALLIRLARVEREADHLRGVRAQVVETYDAKLAALGGEAAAIRDSLKTYVERHGKVSLPDAGTAYLTTRNRGGKPKVIDAAELWDWFEVMNLEPPLLTQLDTRAALDALLDHGYKPTPDGRWVNAESGELLEDVPGVTVEPEARSLAVRG